MLAPALSVVINQKLPPFILPAEITSELLMVVSTDVPKRLLYFPSTEAELGANANCPLPPVSVGKK